MLSKSKKQQISKILVLIIGCSILLVFTYSAGLLVTGLFHGDLAIAEAVVLRYSFVHKVLLSIMTAGILGTLGAIYYIFSGVFKGITE